MLMTPRRRELIFKVADGYWPLIKEHGIIHYLTKYRRCDQMLGWLAQNGYKGHLLEKWVVEVWKHHKLSMVKFIVMKMDRETVTHPIFMGEEYMPRR